MSNRFTSELRSDLEDERRAVDIFYKTETIASVYYEKGIDKLEVEIPPRSESAPRLFFPLKDFVDTLEKAKKLATQYTREDE